MEATKNKRKAISAKKRFEVFKRDGFVCMYCGSHPPEVLLHVDHITPVAEGGGNEMDNLIASCDRCNLGKGATPLSTVPISLTDKAKEIAERELQIRGYQDVMDARRQRIEDEQWEVATIFMRTFGEEDIRRDYLMSIRKFISELGMHECIDAMEIAVVRKPWSKDACFRYFCGVCWSKIRER
jgi:hypothetical protein